MTFLFDVIFWIFKKSFNFMGAKDDQLKWLQKAADELHKRGWDRERLIMSLDERQRMNIETKARALMKEKQNNIEPLRMDQKIYDMPKIVELDMRPKWISKYKTRHGNAKGLVVHYTAGRMEGGALNAHAVMKDMISRGLYCLVMDKDGVIYKAKDFPLNQIGYHAGTSKWKGVSGVSQYCMGMEICCPGKTEANGKAWFGQIYKDLRTVTYKEYGVEGTFVKYTPEQEKALIDFCLWQFDVNPDFDIDWIVGHQEVSPGRKTDPGGSLSWPMPGFRWLLKQKLGRV